MMVLWFLFIFKESWLTSSTVWNEIMRYKASKLKKKENDMEFSAFTLSWTCAVYAESLVRFILFTCPMCGSYLLLELLPEYHDWFILLPMLLPVSSLLPVNSFQVSGLLKGIKGYLWSMEETDIDILIYIYGFQDYSCYYFLVVVQVVALKTACLIFTAFNGRLYPVWLTFNLIYTTEPCK